MPTTGPTTRASAVHRKLRHDTVAAGADLAHSSELEALRSRLRPEAVGEHHRAISPEV